MNLDLNQLRILIALDDERNITKAAERLYVSQSAASHNLAKLRERFNDPLFVRTSQGMNPTPFAQTMLPVLRQGVSNIARAAEMQSSFNPQTDAHTFYIGACDYFEFVAMPLLAEAFVERAPNIRLSIDINSEHVKMERVESGRLDLHIGVNNVSHASKNFNTTEWLRDRYVGVVAKWREIPDKLTTLEFANESQIHLPITANASDVIDNWLHDQKLYRNIHMVTQSYPIGGMISARTGLLFPVPLRVAKLLATMIPLKVVELPEDIPPLQLSIITHKLYDHQESIQWLLQQIHALK
ncbi:LysR family transcriptional regulator [Vibrio sp. WXL103]|uniref:LysR family transcriptional regulator n=1 Tax=Vibrio sp. WXL103 TaxID=3450710 RepID=UPI003EC77631